MTQMERFFDGSVGRCRIPLLFADTNGPYLATLFKSWINITYVIQTHLAKAESSSF